MKLLKYMTLFAVSALLAVSCKNDIEISEISTPDKFVAPIIGSCGNVIVNATNSNAESVIFTWTPADFGQPLQVLYSVYLQSGDATTMMGTSFSNSFAISKGDLNGVVINGLGVMPNETATVRAYVTAEISGTEQYAPRSSQLSNAFSLSTCCASLKCYHFC